jgi:hypothetical protein
MRHGSVRLKLAAAIIVSAAALYFIVSASLPGDQLLRSVAMACRGYEHRFDRYPESKSELWQQLKKDHRSEWQAELAKIDATLTVGKGEVVLQLWGPFRRRLSLDGKLSDLEGRRIAELYLQ